jgi:hypothetical protein
MGPIPKGGKRESELSIFVYDSADRGKPGGLHFEKIAKMYGRQYGFLLLNATDPFHDNRYPCACIKHLVILDHGKENGEIQLGDKPMSDRTIKQMCSQLCDDSTIVLMNCYAGTGRGTATKIITECGAKIKVLWGGAGKTTSSGCLWPKRFDEDNPLGTDDVPDPETKWPNNPDWDDFFPPVNKKFNQ